MNKRVAIAFVLLGITLGATGCGGGTPQPPVQSASGHSLTVGLSPDTSSFDTLRLGRIAEGDVVEGSFGLRNATQRPVVVLQVITGCGCTTAEIDPSPVAPGEERTVTFRFDSRDRFGQQFKSIEIVTADRQRATVYLEAEVY